MKRPQSGFSLIELLTAITVLAVLLAMTVPGFRDFTRSNRVTAAHNDLVTAFTLARSEALKRATTVSVCASNDGTSCTGATNWAGGWIAFTDAGAAGAVNSAAGDTVLQTWPAINGDMTLSGTVAFVQYTATGMVAPASASTFDAYATGCTGSKLRRLTVSAIGSASGTTQPCP
ncbi:MAG TPA: GspH/FimT family pseudopilin [Gemmatimonadaceae bacterium]|nr:GspH/FimT family pseudopilin [Gemmatimonadaceae bacterium]